MAVVLTGALFGCGGSDDKFDPINLGDDKESNSKTTTKNNKKQQPEEGSAEQKTRPYPLLATKNSTRIPGKNAVEDAAYTARVVYPSLDKNARPGAIIVVDKDSWQTGVAASSLVREPLNAPILLSDKGKVPEITEETTEALQPTGVKIGKAKRKVKLIRVGKLSTPTGLRTRNVSGNGPAKIAASIDRLSAKISGSYKKNVVIVSSKSAAYAFPAAAWAAKSGDPVLFVQKSSVPAATKGALSRRDQPMIYVLAPKKLVSEEVIAELRKLGQVQRIAEDTAVKSAIAFARYQAPDFGWGVVDPGHGLVFMNVSRPLDAAASAPLAASGKYGPLLLIDSASKLPLPDRDYLLDIQPGYETDPSRGVYNHAWIMGNDSTISVSVQAQIDRLTEIQKIKQAPNTATVP